ncbi:MULTISPECIES: polysaccharide pyruvyl transferase family protein [Methanobacterium]|uniref:Polysaccharide pyruvyl transferase family protein n=1 Tax=Methanobacterium veterum TaxID=408577 RepID=A0A9E5A3Q3_9EURY|nr:MULTISPECIES: polysaccharide pyruvyl transferase family protein [Methanobacterium]MCZ3367515.1 polysaccharide pyruvyl transferase family protein [Methanobacterium veterum]MCZ3373337.1 polysaccharide pyruvyl transferase family protein [Methanobacterium veterum]
MKNKKSDKILIPAIGPWLDKGQSAMLISMINALMNEFHNPEFVIVASSFLMDEIDKVQYSKYDVEVLPGIFFEYHLFLLKISSIKVKLFRILLAFLSLSSLIILNTLWLIIYKYLHIDAKFLLLNNKDIVNEYKEADYIILCGGQNIIHTVHLPIEILYEMFFGIMLNKPIMLYAQSIGPFNHKYGLIFIKWILNRVNLITTREETSKKLLENMRISSPVYLTADAAFILPSISNEDAKSILKKDTNLPENKIWVGITAIPWNFPSEKDIARKKELNENYVNVLSKISDYIIEKFDANVVFFPQVIVPIVKDDRIVSKKIFKRIKNKDRVKVLTEDYTPEELKGMYGNMAFLIGTRFHSCILSLSMNVPTIAIEYDGHKAFGIMKLIELDKYVLKIETLNLEELKFKVNELSSERNNLDKKIKKNIKIMQNESKRNVLLAKEYL